MSRTIVVAALVAVLATGCEKSGSGSGSGSATAPDPKAIDAMLADMMTYTDQMLPILAAWDSDCAAQAKRMMVLEPSADKIRAEMLALEADPAKQAAFKAAMAGKKDELMAVVLKKAAAVGLSKDDLDHREADMKSKCADNAAFQDAMNHTGLRKKKG